VTEEALFNFASNMNVTYRVKFGDKTAFQAWAVVRQPLMQLGFICFVSIMTYLDVIRGWPTNRTIGFQICYVCFCEFFIICICILILAGSIGVSVLMHKDRQSDAERTLTLGDQGFRVESNLSSTEVKWAGVAKAVKTRNRIFLCLNAVSAVIIPRHAFVSAEAYDTFFEFCRQKVAVFKGNPPPVLSS
jgi:hypothetical protein